MRTFTERLCSVALSAWPPFAGAASASPAAANTCVIRNIRRIRYRSAGDHDVHHCDREFDLNDLANAWLAISPSSGFGAAHAFCPSAADQPRHASRSFQLDGHMASNFFQFSFQVA